MSGSPANRYILPIAFEPTNFLVDQTFQDFIQIFFLGGTALFLSDTYYMYVHYMECIH